VSNLIQLGRQHARIVGFKVEYLDAFMAAMSDVWEAELSGEPFAAETLKAWCMLFLLIKNSVLEGYQQRCSELRFTEPSADDPVDHTDLHLSNESSDFNDETA